MIKNAFAPGQMAPRRSFQSSIMRLLGNLSLVFDYKDLEILQSLHDGKSIIAQFHQPRPDLFVLINSNPVYCNGEIIGAVVSETDVTNQVALNEKLFNMSHEMHRLEQEVAKYKDESDPFLAMNGKSPVIQRTIQLARKVCSVKSTVLILGESGVGKKYLRKQFMKLVRQRRHLLFRLTVVPFQRRYLKANYLGMSAGRFLVQIVKVRKVK